MTTRTMTTRTMEYAPPAGFPAPPDERAVQRRPSTPAGVVAAVERQQEPAGVEGARARCEASVRAYAGALRAGGPRYDDGDAAAAAAAARRRAQQDAVVGELRALRRRVDALSEAAAAHRWRRWLVGGIVASIIPMVRRFFRRSSSSSSSSTDDDKRETTAARNATEHAFARSKALVARILASTATRGGAVAFFVLSVLYVFVNEVELRVARTVARRLGRLAAKVERADAAITDRDLGLFQGWRWRVLTWSE